MPIDGTEIGAKLVRLLHQFLSFRERVNLNFALRADNNESKRILANLITIMHAASFFIEAKLR
jgi:hypothetical protein